MSLKAWLVQIAAFMFLLNGVELRYGLKFVDSSTWQYWVGTAMLVTFAGIIAHLYDKEKK